MKQITGLSGAAHFAPIAAGKAHPNEPAHLIYDCSSYLRSIIVPVHIPECPVSETKIASSGKHFVSSLLSLSGLIGIVSEFNKGETSFFHSFTSCFILRIQSV